MLHELSVVEHGEEFVVGRWRNLLLSMWRGELNKAGLDAAGRVGWKLHKSSPHGFVSLSIILRNVPLPNDEVRAYAAKLMRERVETVHTYVTLIEGDGFLLSAARMVIVALSRLSSTRKGAVIATNLDEAVRPLVRHIHPSASADDVLEAVRAFRYPETSKARL